MMLDAGIMMLRLSLSHHVVRRERMQLAEVKVISGEVTACHSIVRSDDHYNDDVENTIVVIVLRIE